MAIKERKQITGTAAQIKGFAGHNGVLAYATDTKHLHVLSGTAGTTTELANRTDIPEIPDASTLIPKSGNRGSISGYETGGTSSGSTVIDVTSPDSMYITNLEAAGTITVKCSTANVCATKVLRIVGDSTGQIMGGASTTLTWAGGMAPTMKNNMLVIVHYSGKGNEAVVNAIALE